MTKLSAVLLFLTSLLGQASITEGIDLCPAAAPLLVGAVASGNTNPATPDPADAIFCDTSYTNAPGVWYTVEGTGGTLTASTCGSTYDTKVHVYTGSCGSFSCVGGNDDSCGLQSRVTFDSTLGETYHILVHGFSSAAGQYQLEVMPVSQ